MVNVLLYTGLVGYYSIKQIIPIQAITNNKMDHIFLIDIEQKASTTKLSKKIQIVDSVSAFLGILGIFLAYFEYENFCGDIVTSMDSSGSLIIQILSPQYVETSYNTMLRTIIGISSGLLCITIYFHHRLKIKLLILKQKIDNYETLFSTKRVWVMLLEILICIVHCPPGFNWVFKFEQYGGSLEYSYNMFAFLFMLGRVYLIWRLFEHYSSWNDEESEEVCNSCLCEGGVKFAIKAELKERPYIIVITCLFFSILIFGVALRTLERPFMHVSGKDWNYTWNGMWCIIITMTTVGYGDFYPTTHLGRCVDVIACFWGTFLISLMVLALSISSELTPQERKAFNLIKKNEMKNELEVAAINTIKSAIKLWLFTKNNALATERQSLKMTKNFEGCLKVYRRIKKYIKANEQEVPFEYILAKLNEKVSYGLDEIKNKCFVYKTLLARLDTSEVTQQSLKNNIQTLKEINASILTKLQTLKKLKKLGGLKIY